MRSIIRRYSSKRKFSGASRTISRWMGSKGTRCSFAVNWYGTNRRTNSRATCTEDSPGRAPPPQKCTKLRCAPRFIILYAATAESNPPDSRHIIFPAVFAGKPPGPGNLPRIDERRPRWNLNAARQLGIVQLHANIEAVLSQAIQKIPPHRGFDLVDRCGLVASLRAHRKRLELFPANLIPKQLGRYLRGRAPRFGPPCAPQRSYAIPRTRSSRTTLP